MNTITRNPASLLLVALMAGGLLSTAPVFADEADEQIEEVVTMGAVRGAESDDVSAEVTAHNETLDEIPVEEE